jgi:hypothetical protein
VPGPWWWRLPPNIATIPKSGYLGNLGNLAKNTGNSTNLDAGEAKVAKIAKLNNLGNLGDAVDTVDAEEVKSPTPTPAHGRHGLFDDYTIAGPYLDGL